MRYKKVDTCEQLIEDPTIIQAQLIDYIIYMREELQLSQSTINNRLAAIKKFYETNEIELKWKKIKSYIGKGGKKRIRKDRGYTHIEIAKMLEAADQRGKIAILLMFSAGIRVGAITSLKIRDLEKMEKFGLYKIKVYENDEGEYTSFCTPECAAMIDSYLAYRQINGERPLKEDASLIRELFNIHDELKARPRAISTLAFRKMIRMIGLKSGVIERRPVINGQGERRLVKSTHGFRKAFQTNAINAGMAPLYAEILMGHVSGGLALESYLKPTDNDLLEGNDKMIGYAGIIDTLTINEENKLRSKINELTEKQDEIQKMKQNYEQEMRTMRQEMENKFQQILSKIDVTTLSEKSSSY